MIRLNATSFALGVLLLVGLVKAADWLAPYEASTVAQACTLNNVYDGDTVALDCAGERITARLLGFDTPEATSPQCAAEKIRADQATARLRVLADSGVLTFSGNTYGKYGRLLVTMKVDGQDVGNTLIDEGLAVRYDGGRRIDWCARLKN